MRLLGVIFAGFEYDVEGKIARRNPTSQFLTIPDDAQTVISKIPMNIVYVVKSTTIIAFEKILKEKLEEMKPDNLQPDS